MKTTIKRMSDPVIECELRAAWADVECAVRHGVEVSKRLGDYVSALEAEKARRAAR